jgi:hypothetical protein
MFHLTGEEFYTKWEVFAVNQGIEQDVELDRDLLDQLKQVIQAEFMKKTSAGIPNRPSKLDPNFPSTNLPKRTVLTSETLQAKMYV